MNTVRQTEDQKKRAQHSLYFNSLLLVLITLLIVFLVFISAFAVIYARSASYLTRAAVEETSQSLSYCAQEISSAFERNWTLLTSSEWANSIKRSFSMQRTSSLFYSRLLTLHDDLRNSFARSSLFPGVMLLHLDESGSYLCSSNFISDNFERDYDNGLFSYADMDYDEFISFIASSVDHRYTRSAFHSGLLTYHYSNGYSANTAFFIYRFTAPSADAQIFALVQFDIDQLHRTLSGFRYAGDYFSLSGTDGEFCATAPSLSLAPAEGGVYRDGLSDTLYLCSPIDKVNLTCYLSLDNRRITAAISYFSSLLSILLYVFMVLILALVIVLFMRWSYPIIRIAQRIRDTGHPATASSPVLQIDTHISDLEKRNASVEQILETLEPAAQRELTLRFLQGDPLSEVEKRIISDHFHLAQEGVFRILVFGCLNQTDSVSSLLLRAFDAAREALPQLTSCTLVGDILIAVMPQDNLPAEDCRAVLETLLDSLNLSLASGCLFALGVSDAYVGYAGAPSAYREAVAGWLDAQTWHNSSVVFGSDPKNRSSRYRFDYEQLESLHRALQSGSAEEALRIYDQVAQENFNAQRGARPRQLVCQQFYDDIVGLIVRLSMRHDVMPILEPLLNGRSHGSISEMLATLRAALCDCLELLPREKGDSSLSAQIQTYLGEHYSDPSLSLCMVADHFGLAESNLSKFFKARTGVTFSAYVENLRMRQAEELLTATNLPVRDVAARVGYGTTATFYNAFRRTHNMTPSQYQAQRRQSPQS